MNISFRTSRVVALATIGLLGAISSRAQVVAIQSVSYVPGDIYAPVADATYGWKFTVDASSSLSLTQLGLLDVGSSGFAEAHRVGIWDSGNNLVADVTFAAGETGTLNNGFRYLPVSSVVLQAGQSYSIGSWSATSLDGVVQSASAAVYSSDISYGGASYAPPGSSGTGFLAPYQNFGGSHGVFGANFEFQLTPVPEPEEYALTATVALAIFAVWRKFRGV